MSDDRPYTDDDADADDTQAAHGVSDDNRDAEPLPSAGDADQPTPDEDD